MLKILVCVKQVPDVDLVKMDPVTGNLIRDGVPAILNPLDANALAAAMKVKEQYGGEITVVTMGPPMAETALRECLAVGADKAVLITGREFGGADTLATSYAIAKAAKQADDFDLVFCGKESMDGATGQMGSQLAERFGFSQITSLSLIESVDEENKKAVVEREMETGTAIVEVNIPCLFTVEKANYPARLPSLKGKLAAKKKEIPMVAGKDIQGLESEKIGVAGSGTVVPRIYPPELPEPGDVIDEGDTAASVCRLCDILASAGRL